MDKRKIMIYTMGLVGVSMMLCSLFLFITREVGGFDILDSNAHGCTPYNVVIKKGDAEYSVVIDWKTKDKCLGYLQYGRDTGNLDSIGVDLLHEVNSKDHTVVLEKLLTTQRYFVIINSDDTVYGTEGIPLEFRISDL